ncbi:er membrane duf1077 domain protein [Grosmannia clavigera kw1407]|uniref:ER membrane protein complex subunit 4 n=1 Tax=Grosmannia clavigera (strain kw1407 / UAMH 11150) TaxID=655863 RepID=F0XSP5_GROCL|nr:er membrane duf1077 domain protein [Grosmannia clavigera kw1407]EFW99348.1 er membrane duf1077 domain protein [Grosmannia clavigera kw1407]
MSELKLVPAAPPRWVLELESPPPRAKANGIIDPAGFPSQAPSTGGKKRDGKDAKTAPPAKKPPTPEQMDTLKVKKAWEVALAPIKSLPMTAIMMYMSGNSLQIFTIMTVFMAFKNPIAGLLATQSTFERFESPTNGAQLLQVKLAYVVFQFVALAMGVWKVNAMGLLPTTRSDWLAWEFQPDPLEVAVPAL